jgi:hypothetical protein
VSEFDISTVLNISPNRLTHIFETYNKGKFIEYDAVIDSLYCITIIKVGERANNRLFDSIKFDRVLFSSDEGWFNNNRATAFTTVGFSANYVSWYNVLLLPLEQIDDISVWISGKVVDKDTTIDNTISYSLISYSIAFSFNRRNLDDLDFTHISLSEPTLSNLAFTIDKEQNCYIMHISTTQGRAKTLREILDDTDTIR